MVPRQASDSCRANASTPAPSTFLQRTIPWFSKHGKITSVRSMLEPTERGDEISPCLTQCCFEDKRYALLTAHLEHGTPVLDGLRACLARVRREPLGRFDGKQLCATLEEKPCVLERKFASPGRTTDTERLGWQRLGMEA